MATKHYIILISEKGILPKDEVRYKESVIDIIEGIFGPVKEITGTRWYLSNGVDEKIYHATPPELPPARDKEFRKTTLKNLRETIEATKRNLKIFKLEEVMIN